VPIRAAREHAGAIGREGDRSDPTRVRYLCNDLELHLAFRSSRDVSKQHKRNHGQHSKKNPEAQTLWEIAPRVPQPPIELHTSCPERHSIDTKEQYKNFTKRRASLAPIDAIQGRTDGSAPQ